MLVNPLLTVGGVEKLPFTGSSKNAAVMARLEMQLAYGFAASPRLGVAWW